MSLEAIPLVVERKEPRFDLFEVLLESLNKNKVDLHEGDVLVISAKFVSNSQNRVVHLNNIKPTKKGLDISKRFKIIPKIAEIIVRESDEIFGGISGFVITSSDHVLAPNAGIDKSNAKHGDIILYPNDPYQTAEDLKRKIFLKFAIHVGVILADSRLMPSRIGTVGIAIACAGIEPVLDMRAKNDLYGNPLKVTFQATVDSLATIANHKMGEGRESKPFVVIRDPKTKLTNRRIYPNEIAISPDQCVYVRGFRNKHADM